MSKPTLAKNTTYFTGALTVQKILAFIYFWFISNNLFPEQLGQYVFALSFTTLFSIFIDLGLAPILTREAAKNQNQANLYLQNILGLKLPLAFLTLIAVWIVINLTGKPPETLVLVYLASIIMILDSFSLSFWVIFRARQNLKYESLATILVQIIIFVLGTIALKTTGQIRYLVAGLLVASVFNFCLSLGLLKFKLRFSLKPRLDRSVITHFIKIVPAFALSGIFVKIYNTSDSVLLSYLGSDAAVAFYAVPAKVVFALQQVIPAAFAAAMYPVFSHHFATSKTLLAKSFTQSFTYLIIISIPITAGLITIIPEATGLFWPSYRHTIPTFFVMTLALPFIFLAYPTGYLLNSADKQKMNTVNRGIVTVMAVVLNIILIPKFSFFGTGITFLVTNVILVLLDFYWVNQTITVDLGLLMNTLMKSILAALIMVVTILIVQPVFNIFVVVPFGMTVYFISLWLVKGFTRNDIKKMLNRNVS